MWTVGLAVLAEFPDFSVVARRPKASIMRFLINKMHHEGGPLVSIDFWHEFMQTFLNSPVLLFLSFENKLPRTGSSDFTAYSLLLL